MDHVVLKNRRTTLERCEKFISDELSFFSDVSLYWKIYPEKSPLKSLTHYSAPGRITYDEALKGVYKPAKVGESFGPAWSTHWFRVQIEIPAKWEGKEVHLLWNSHSEALVWQKSKAVAGLSGDKDRISFTLTKHLKAKERSHELYIEMACNTLFGAGDSLIGPPDPKKHFTLSQAEIAVRDNQAFQLYLDFEIIIGMAKHLGENNERGNEAMLTANRMVNQVVANGGSYENALKISKAFLTQKNGESQHVVYAVGHCHIDTAWLWPYAETIRKCARSWSTTLTLMKEYPDFIFACSQAQQYEWVKEHYPGLYTEISKMVKTGRFLPVGGCWVEMDGNMPSGEAFVRQFLYGQRYFQQEFNFRCKEFWLPDTFGYSGQLPQIMKLFGLDRFLTQKISWNLINKFPHNTFWWEGIDGSRVLTHFPPGDCYTMKAQVEEILKTRDNHGDKGRSAKTMFLFGHGDGGQGPSEEMLERLIKMKDVDGTPKVKLGSPDEYFSAVEASDLQNLCTWTGELYLEMHNGTYTSQAQTKYYNRKCEFWLHDVETMASIAVILAVQKSYEYPSAELLRLWKLLLLNQFHDVLPGSSIAEVYEDAVRYYKDIEESSHNLMSEAIAALSKSKGEEARVVFNTQGWERREVITLPSGEMPTSPAKKKARRETPNVVQTDCNGNTIVLVSAPSCGLAPVQPCTPVNPASASKQAGGFCLKNGLVEALINKSGHITELYVRGSKRNALSADHPGNVFVIYDDVPLFWDAWDVMHYHLETRKAVDKLVKPATVVESGPLRAALQVSWKISDKSSIKQTISLDADCPFVKFETQVEWHESHKFLKVEFPTSVKCDNATYDIQFGHLQRPTHNNTSWDMAKFEVCSHKWADLSEYDFGVSILNDSKYGFSTARNVMRLSLLKAPKAPDADADMGTQRFTYAVMPHTGSFQSAGVIQQSYNLNCPLTQGLIHSGDSVLTHPGAFFKIDTQQVVLDTIKRAEDNEKALVLRMFEAFGGTTTATLHTNLPVKEVTRCDGYEEAMTDEENDILQVSGNTATITFSPFQIISLMLKF
ncbi:alpha-mannosidase 2C1-like [Liolophura sinensis]|uniref:alpha-mannosidase 2C1-like n=1 Tax=Liolophura sinensis TaxID=3198878 RepID=UPI0031582987